MTVPPSHSKHFYTGEPSSPSKGFIKSAPTSNKSSNGLQFCFWERSGLPFKMIKRDKNDTPSGDMQSKTGCKDTRGLQLEPRPRLPGICQFDSAPTSHKRLVICEWKWKEPFTSHHQMLGFSSRFCLERRVNRTWFKSDPDLATETAADPNGQTPPPSEQITFQITAKREPRTRESQLNF